MQDVIKCWTWRGKRLLTRKLSRNLEHCSCQGVGNAAVTRSNYEYIRTVTNTITAWIFNRTNTKQPRWTQEAREGWKCSTASTHLINSLHGEVECHEFTDGLQASLWKTKNIDCKCSISYWGAWGGKETRRAVTLRWLTFKCKTRRRNVTDLP